MATVRHLGFYNFRNFCQKFKLSLISRSTCKIWWRSARSASELLRIFDFQNGGRTLSWICYDDVISDHPRLVFDDPNILLKLHVDRVYTLQDIAIFIFGPFGLKLPIHAPFGKILVNYPKWIPILSEPTKGPSLDENTSYKP